MGDSCNYMTGHTSTETHVSVCGHHIALESQCQASARHAQHAHTSPAAYSGNDAGTVVAACNYVAAAGDTVDTHTGGTHSAHTHHVATCRGTIHASEKGKGIYYLHDVSICQHTIL